MAKQREEAAFVRGSERPLDVQLHAVVPDGQWEVVDVTFTAANADTQVAYTRLVPPTAESVEYTVLRQTGLGTVYEDRSAARAKWGDGYIILRSTAPQTVRILLRVLKTPKDWSLTDTAASATVTVPGLTIDTLSGYLKGTAGVVSAQSAPLPVADLGTGTPTSGKYLRGDGAWQAIAESEITDGSLLARVGANETITGDWQFDGYVKLRDGTLGAATLAAYFTNDTNTGVYRYGIDDMRFVAGGNARLRVLSTEVQAVDSLTIVGNLPFFHIYESDGSTDSKYWRHYASGDYYYFDVVNDGYSSSSAIFSVSRSAANARILRYYAGVAYETTYAQTGLNGSYNDVGSGTNRDAVSLYTVASSSGAVTWTGLTGGLTGKVAWIINFEGAQTLTLSHESSSSSAANRFYCPNGANYVIPTYGSVQIVYYGSRWMVVGPVA